MSLTYSHDEARMPMYKGLKAREGHSFSLTSPSLFRLEPSLFCDGSECDPKCEGKVRDIWSPSRPSNALCIRVWGLRCEKVRAILNAVKKGANRCGWLPTDFRLFRIQSKICPRDCLDCLWLFDINNRMNQIHLQVQTEYQFQYRSRERLLWAWAGRDYTQSLQLLVGYISFSYFLSSHFYLITTFLPFTI